MITAMGEWQKSKIFDYGGRRADSAPKFYTQECAMYMNDAERALTAIEDADSAGFLDVAWMDMCPLLGALRDHPRFRVVHEHAQARAAPIEAAYQEPMLPVR